MVSINEHSFLEPEVFQVDFGENLPVGEQQSQVVVEFEESCVRVLVRTRQERNNRDRVVQEVHQVLRLVVHHQRLSQVQILDYPNVFY